VNFLPQLQAGQFSLPKHQVSLMYIKFHENGTGWEGTFINPKQAITPSANNTGFAKSWQTKKLGV